MSKYLAEYVDEEIAKFLFGDNWNKQPYCLARCSNSFQQGFENEYPDEYKMIVERCKKNFNANK